MMSSAMMAGRPAVCGVVLLRGDGAVLLQLRDSKPGIQDPGMWVFPGGHVDPGESLEAGARREFFEETRYRLGDLQELVRFSAREIGYSDDYPVVFYWGRFDGRQPFQCCEGQDLRFVSRQAVERLPKCGYLARVWDLALAAGGIRSGADQRPREIDMKTIPDLELSHRSITSIGRYRDLDIGGIQTETLLALFRQMLRLRRIEEALVAEYHPADEMRCPIHFCIGQEAVPAALSRLVEPEDCLFSHHRSHGYYFAKGAPLRELFAEIYGKQTGANSGRAGSQDISHHASRFYSGAILSGAVSISIGAAYGLQLKKSRNISISGFGEGATDEGAFWEAMNHSAARRLPVLFVCENNRYATYSDQLKRQAADNICERVATFGVRTRRVFGNDVTSVYRALADEMARVRAGEGPALVEAYTHRWNSHVGPEDDGVNEYRSQQEIQFWKDNCPVLLLGEELEKAGHLAASLRARFEHEISEEIAACFQFAKQSPFPSSADWRAMNWDDSSPLGDRLLGTHSRSEFDQYQPEAKLEPY